MKVGQSINHTVPCGLQLATHTHTHTQWGNGHYKVLLTIHACIVFLGTTVRMIGPQARCVTATDVLHALLMSR